jgi:hypothetical protein
MNSEKKFDKILQESVDSAFSLLGEKSKTAIYLYLKNKFMITEQDIPKRLEDFSDALEQLFGLGARHLEILIMKELNEKISSTYTWEGPSWLVPDLTFRKYVILMELSYNDRGKIGDFEIVVEDEEKQQNEY